MGRGPLAHHLVTAHHGQEQWRTVTYLDTLLDLVEPLLVRADALEESARQAGMRVSLRAGAASISHEVEG